MISSRNNPLIVETALLKTKKFRKKNRAYLIEGTKLFYEAVDQNLPMTRIFATTEWLKKNQINFPADIIPVSKPVLEKLSSLKSQEGVIAELPYILKKPKPFNKAIILDNINDPGNLGTIIRTADCAGYNQVFLTKGCADIYNQKTLRASMGSIFRVDIEKIDLRGMRVLKEQGFELIATALNGKEIFMNEIEVPEKFVLIFGNESNGLSKDILELSSQRIKIPIYGKAESLNVAIASAVIMYAYIDQKKE